MSSPFQEPTCSICLGIVSQKVKQNCSSDHAACKQHLQKLASDGNNSECDLRTPSVLSCVAKKTLSNLTEQAPATQTSKGNMELAKVFIKISNGILCECQVQETDTIESLKILVAQREGLPLDRIRLVCAGKNMEGHKTFKYYQVNDWTVVHQLNRYRGGPSSRDGPSAKQRHSKSLAPQLVHNTNRSKDGGIENLGNTCYMNSAIQALRSLREFVADLRHMQTALPYFQTEAERNSFQLYFRTMELMDDMSNTSHQALSPAKLKAIVSQKMPLFRGHQQHDAHEFLQEFINVLHNELCHASRGYPSDWESRIVKLQAAFPHVARSLLIQILKESNGIGTKALAALRSHDPGCNNLQFKPENEMGSMKEQDLATEMHFVSEVETAFSCTRCKGTKRKRDRLYDHSLRLPAQSGESRRLEDMLAGYLSDETLSTKCEECCMKTMHNLHKCVVSLPRVLMLHINRDGDAGGLASNAAVEIPPSLCLDHAHPCYALRSVVARFGTTSETGHYVCYAVDEKGTWRKYDDRIVQAFGNEAPKSLGHQAHIVFYVQDDPWAPPTTRDEEEQQLREALDRSRSQCNAMPTIQPRAPLLPLAPGIKSPREHPERSHLSGAQTPSSGDSRLATQAHTKASCEGLEKVGIAGISSNCNTGHVISAIQSLRPLHRFIDDLYAMAQTLMSGTTPDYFANCPILWTTVDLVRVLRYGTDGGESQASEIVARFESVLASKQPFYWNCQQDDFSLFLESFILALQQELLLATKNYRKESMVRMHLPTEHYFSSTLQTSIYCDNCMVPDLSENACYCLPMSFPKHCDQSSISLIDLINDYFESARCQFLQFCNRCRESRTFTQEIQLQSVAPVLMLRIDRSNTNSPSYLNAAAHQSTWLDVPPTLSIRTASSILPYTYSLRSAVAMPEPGQKICYVYNQQWWEARGDNCGVRVYPSETRHFPESLGYHARVVFYVQDYVKETHSPPTSLSAGREPFQWNKVDATSSFGMRTNHQPQSSCVPPLPASPRETFEKYESRRENRISPYDDAQRLA